MCEKVTCRKCNKPTWAGCGEHVEQALAGIAIADRCAGHTSEVKKVGILSRLFKR
jgi:hypothetical protein